MKAKHQLLEGTLERVGRIISQKYDVRVVFQHGSCHTDGRVITLPVVPDNAPQGLIDAMQGHLDHEVGHVVDSDFAVVRKARLEDGRLHAVFQGLEDLRIEKRQIDRWRGSAALLRSSLEWTLQELLAVPEEGLSRWERISEFGKLVTAASVYGQVGFDAQHWFLRKAVPSPMMDQILLCEDVLHAATDALSSGAVLVLSREFLERLPPPEEEPQQQSSGDPGSLGAGGGGLMPAAPPPMPPPPMDEELTNRARMLADAAREAMSSAPPSSAYRVFTTDGDRVEEIKKGSRAECQRLLRQSNRIVTTMRTRLMRSLLATVSGRWETNKTRGRLDPRAVIRVALGSAKNVFRQRVESPGFDTAVLIMVDHSGSMRDGKLEVAAATALVLGEVLDRLRIPFAILGFSTGIPDVAAGRMAQFNGDKSLFTRWGDHWIGVYKDFGDLWTTNRERVAVMPKHRRWNTYDGESLRFGAQKLLERSEQRRVMFWLNDGEPYPNEGEPLLAHQAHAHACAREVEGLVELVAIGICTSAVKEYYRHCAVVRSVHDLAASGLAELDAILRRGFAEQKHA